MKTVYIDFKDNWALYNKDFEEEALWYSYEYNRVGIDNVTQVTYLPTTITIEYKPTTRSKIIYKKSFNTVAIKNMTINNGIINCFFIL